MHSEALREAGEFEENLGEREEERKQEEPPMARKEEAGGREEEIIATMTLAELYASQGFLEKAIEIYQKVLSREPTNEVAKKRIESMMRGEPRSQAGGEAQPAGEEAAREGNSGIDWERGGAPGEIEVDEEFEKFKKWLTDLTKKKGS
jgi:tetratricopeptide (TPR) repeat protein